MPENEAVARRWHEGAIDAGNVAVIAEIVTEDVIHHAGRFPDGEGLDATTPVLGALLTGFPDVERTIERVIASGEIVVIRFQATGTHEGEFQRLAATGRVVGWSGITIFRFECGRIPEDWSEENGLGRIRQLEAEATPTA